MKRLRIRRIGRAICVVGFILMLGTAGASDAGAISFGRSVCQLLAGLAMFAGGGTLGGVIKW